jgi:hypothetical protein
MKQKKLIKGNKISIDKKTIAKLDQSSLSSINGGNEAAGTTTSFWMLHSITIILETTATITTIH